MLVINFLIKLKETTDLFSDLVFNLIKVLRKNNIPKEVYFICDKLQDCENVELIDGVLLFDEAIKEGKNAYYIISKHHPDYERIKRKYKNKILEYSSHMHIKHFFKFIRLNKVLSTFELKTPYNKFFHDDENIDFIFVQHGPTLLKKHIFELYNQNEYNKVVVSNDIEAELFEKFGLFKNENIIKAGLPRFDILKNQPSSKKSILLYMTWRLSFGTVDYKESQYYNNINSLIKDSDFNNFLKQHNIDLNIGIHHTLTENFKNINIINSRELNKYIQQSDMLITDYSSIWADFFLLNKPVIFYRPDTNDENLIQRDKEDILFASESDYLFFNITSSKSELIEIIHKYVQNNFVLEDDFKNKQNKMFYKKNNIRKAILEQA